MFLSYLDESNKEGFLKICVHAAMANGIFADAEHELIDAYCREMNIDVHVPDVIETLDEVIMNLEKSITEKDKNIIVLETYALVKSDGIYDENEEKFMNLLINGLKVSKEKLLEFSKLLDKYTEIGQELYKAVME